MRRKQWTTLEDKFLRENYQEMTIKEIAEKLGRTYGSVVGRINYTGIKKNIKYAVYENNEIVMIGTMDELMERLNIKRRTILYYTTPWHMQKLKREGTPHRRYIKKL